MSEKLEKGFTMGYSELLSKSLEAFNKGGPYIGKRGGKWADAKHTIPWKEGKKQRSHAHGGSERGFHNDHKDTKADGHNNLRRRHDEEAEKANQKMHEARKDSNEYFAHRHDREYHIAMSEAHSNMVAHKRPEFSSRPDKSTKMRIKEALASAREHKKNSEEAFAMVEKHAVPKNAQGATSIIGTTRNGKGVEFYSEVNFRDSVHKQGWTSEDHADARKHHKEQAAYHEQKADSAKTSSEAADHNKAAKYHRKAEKAHMTPSTGFRAGIHNASLEEAAHAAKMRDK